MEISSNPASALPELNQPMRQPNDLARAEPSKSESIELRIDAQFFSLRTKTVKIQEAYLMLLQQAQRVRTAKMDDLNELISALRKLAGSKDDYKVAQLDDLYVLVSPDSPIDIKDINSVNNANKKLRGALDDAINSNPFVKNWIPKGGYTTYFDRESGQLSLYHPNGQWYGFLNFDKTNPFTNPIDHKNRSYWTNLLREKYDLYVQQEKITLKEMLYEYGIYKEGDKLPDNKDQLEIAIENITAKISAVNAEQSKGSTGLQKLMQDITNAYNEMSRIQEAQNKNTEQYIGRMTS